MNNNTGNAPASAAEKSGEPRHLSNISCATNASLHDGSRERAGKRSVANTALSLRRNQVMLLADMNGILAAQALNMRECEKVQGIGSTLVAQQCST